VVRHSSTDELTGDVKAWESLGAQGQFPDGHGMDYRLFRCVPASPPVAKFLRRYVTLREALLRIRAESPRRLPAQKSFIRDGCNAVLAGLGSYPWNYEAAEVRLVEWCSRIFIDNGFRSGEEPSPSVSDPRPQVAAAAELRILVSHLIIAYADPHRFFSEVAPKYAQNQFAPNDFDPERLADPLWLGNTLWRWGFGALLNEGVRRAFDSATADQLIEVIGQAEGRERYREGNPFGSGKGKAKKKRVDLVGTKATVNARATAIEKVERLARGGTKRAIEEVAKAQKRTPAAIRKRMTRASRK
jgi:hypothetical protein